MLEETTLSKSSMASVFMGTTVRRIGIEVECAALGPATGTSVPYHGEHGIRSLIEGVLSAGSGDPVFDNGQLVGIRYSDGGALSLENGGAVEYSSPPKDELVDLVDVTRRALTQIADIGRPLDIAIVPGANYPFNDMGNVHWMPLSRGPLVRSHFESLGPGSEWGREVMALTLSTQVTFDYASAEDLVKKMQMQVAVSPFAAALFVNSPLECGLHGGVLSSRRRYWSRIDRQRTGLVPPAVGGEFSVERFISWASGLPMIYRRNGERYEPAPRRSFRSLLSDGFDDGTRATLDDWAMHLSQIFTDVRLRGTLEVRAVDGPQYSCVPTVPAFWTGLTYDADSCASAWQLVRGWTAGQLRAVMSSVPERAIRAKVANIPVREIAAELLRLSRSGLQARVDAGLEAPRALAYLDPLEEVISTGQTFAEQCLARWQGDLHGEPSRYVEAYRI